MENYFKILILLLIVGIMSCSPPYNEDCSQPDGFTAWARANLIEPLDTTLAWDESFSSVIICQIAVSSQSILVAQHPIFPNEEIELGVYCEPGVYDERIPFNEGSFTLVRLRSWESNIVTLGCDIGGGVPCTIVPPISDGEHEWSPNTDTNWLLIFGNEDCTCIPFDEEDCEWRQPLFHL